MRYNVDGLGTPQICVVYFQEQTVNKIKDYLEQIHRDFQSPREGDTPSPRKREYGLVIDGKTLAFALEPELQKLFLVLAGKCNSVICCRSSPIQKVRGILR